MGWGIKPNPVWPATPSNGQGSARLSLPSPRGAKSRGFWRFSEVQQGEVKCKEVAESARRDTPH